MQVAVHSVHYTNSSNISLFRSSPEVILQNFHHQSLELQAVQSNDLHEYDTMQNVTISKNIVPESNKKDEVCYTQCEAYKTHNLTGSYVAKASSLKNAKPKNIKRGMKENYEDRSDQAEKDLEDVYEVI